MTEFLNKDIEPDDPADRLLEQGLREVLGGEQPPDLSARILNELHASPQSEATAVSQPTSKRWWIALATVACLLLMAGLIVPSLPRFRVANVSFDNHDRDGKSSDDLVASDPDSEYLHSDYSGIEENGPNTVSENNKANVNMATTFDIQTSPAKTPPADWAATPKPGMATAPPTKLNTETRTRTIEVDGEKKSVSYAVQIPYTKQVEQDATLSDPARQLGQAPSLSKGVDRLALPTELRGNSALVLDESGPAVTVGLDPVSGPPTPDLDKYKRGLYNGRVPAVTSFAHELSTKSVQIEFGIEPARGSNKRIGQDRFGEFDSGRFEQAQDGLGQGATHRGDQYVRIHENRFINTEGWEAVSTFSIDVDTASYTNVRQMLLQGSTLPPPDAVRIEELVNYFDYDYAGPAADDEKPFASHIEVAGCPWHSEHRLVRIGLKGREMQNDKRPLSNIVFLVDVSGSMQDDNKLPLVIESLKYMAHELGENDRVAIVVYASAEGLALPSTRGDDQDTILGSLNGLSAGGSTAGGAGIQLAYKVAAEHFVKGGTNRVILCTDGDFNVGVTSTAELERLAEQQAQETGVFLTVLGFGRGNLNDAMMESISNKGNGNYHYIDSLREGRRVLVEQMSGTLVTIAKDVKIQVEFNPTQVESYRLIGYENRMLAREDFDDDTKDAGEIGAGHAVTALYEIVPTGVKAVRHGAEPLKYQPEFSRVNANDDVEDASHAGADKDGNTEVNKELLTLRIRYKPPTSDTSTKIEFPVTDNGATVAEASDDFKFAAAVGSFGMLLRGSRHRGDANLESVLELATDGKGKDPRGYQAEFLELVKCAQKLTGERQ